MWLVNVLRTLFRATKPAQKTAGPGSAEGVADAPAPLDLSPPADKHPLITTDLLRRLGVPEAEQWALPLIRAATRRGIVTADRIACFLGTVLHESAGCTRLVESLNYSPEGILRTWPSHFTPLDAARLGRRNGQLADQRAIAERAYGGRMGNGIEGCGDGYRFRGRGLIQITGRANYEAAARALGQKLETFDAYLETKTGAAEASAWWWQANGCNEIADTGDLVALRRRVNGGIMGLEHANDRINQVRAALRGVPVKAA